MLPYNHVGSNLCLPTPEPRHQLRRRGFWNTVSTCKYQVYFFVSDESARELTCYVQFIAHRVGLILHRIWLDPLAKFPGPKLLAASNLPLRLHSDFTGQWIYHVAALHRQYGPVVRIGPKHLSYDGSIGWEAFARPKPGQPEFSKHFAYHHGNEESIVGASREIHRRQRRQLGHAFSEAAMGEQETTIMGYIDMFIKLLDKHAKTQEPFDIVKCLNFTTFDIIGDLSFGESFNGLTSNELHPWVEAIAGNFRGGCMMRFGLYYPLLMPLVTFLLDISGINSVKDRDETRRLGVEKGLRRLEMGELLPNGQRDFMSYMLRKGQQGTAMSNEECLANSIILVIAGSETTATLLSGLFFYQGMNPDVHATLKKEIREAFADESEINMKSVAQLPYLQACIEESLRVYPPAAETPARVSPGAELGGEYVPSGVS